MNAIYYSNYPLSFPLPDDCFIDSLVYPKRQKETDFRIKYKTEICRNWELGSCEFGNNCAFAHGYEELRNKTSTGNNYKTKKCKQFHELGYCIYGNRCQFKHRDPSTDNILSSPKNNLLSRKSSEDSSKRRLQIFIELEKKGEQ